ncbi:MAG: alcohol dehydrogenase catalytic domain-containing protein [Deltaproteobacteria bacterium]|nr:alcohol dehydrogenase catalytic domain-containing protein [Deltaproteobacteria bacterium]
MERRSGHALVMRAAVVRKPGSPLSIEARALPRARGQEVVVRVRGAGVCHTDLELAADEEREGASVLGHEIAGEADGIGPVLVYPAWGCGRCAYCRAGDEQLCPRSEFAGFGRDGGFAEHVLVPSRRHLFPLGGLDPVRAAVLADAGLTAYRAVRRVRSALRDGGTAIVIGAGGLGQFALQYLRLRTRVKSVVAVDSAPEKRARALDLGADEALAPRRGLPAARAVLDFVGSDSTLRAGAQALEPGGAFVLVGAAGGTLGFGLETVPADATFLSSISGSLGDLAAVLEHARRGDLDWHVETLPLDRVNDALARLRRGDVLGRLVLTP